MDRGSDPDSRLLSRAASDFLFKRVAEPREQDRAVSGQAIPVNVYDTGEDVVIVAPMPGVQAENIDIEVVGTSVTLRAEMRGPGQENRRYMLREWTYGPYERRIDLPFEVDPEHANASHDNGILVLSLPKSARTKTVRVPLRQVTSSESVRQGHSGHHSTRDGLRDE